VRLEPDRVPDHATLLQALGWVMFRRREQGRLRGAGLQGIRRRLRAALEQRAANPVLAHRRHLHQRAALWPALWSFTTNPLLQPTSNAAEQALRSLVLKRKISGPTCSLRGDQFLARGFNVHGICLRQGLDLWRFMHNAVLAFIDKTAPPSLLPAPVAAPSG